MTLRRRPMIMSSLAALAAPGASLAQQPAPGKVWRIGVLLESIHPGFMRTEVARRMAALGYIEGRNLVIDVKHAQDKPERLPGLAAELLAARPDVLLGFANPEIIALKRATTTVPIVMLYAGLPVELGLIRSLARPGGNVTGTTSLVPEMVGKMYQILREAVPRMSKLSWLGDPDYPGMAIFGKYADRAVKSMGLRQTNQAIRSIADLDPALARLERERPDAIYLSSTGVMNGQMGRIIEFAVRHRLPAMYDNRIAVANGGLMSYAPDFAAIGQRYAWMIDKIFKGAKPSEIPVEEPARFQLVINMKTARAMGLVIPPTVLLQATELIE
jgi:putative ABC transport system substrate-binding protein